MDRIIHDLRGSLNAVGGWAELLKRKVLDDEKAVAAGETISRQIRRQLELVNELAEVCRASVRSSDTAAAAAVDLRPLLRDIVDAAERESAAGITFDVQLSEDAPAVAGDSAALEQALSLFITSVMRSAPDGGNVRIRLTQLDGLVTLTVDAPPPSNAGFSIHLPPARSMLK